jgi:hypothetical protein
MQNSCISKVQGHIRHYVTSRKVDGSKLDEVNEFSQFT